MEMNIDCSTSKLYIYKILLLTKSIPHIKPQYLHFPTRLFPLPIKQYRGWPQHLFLYSPSPTYFSLSPRHLLLSHFFLATSSSYRCLPPSRFPRARVHTHTACMLILSARRSRKRETVARAAAVHVPTARPLSKIPRVQGALK